MNILNYLRPVSVSGAGRFIGVRRQVMRMLSVRDILWVPRRRCGCGEIGIRGGLKIHWGFPRCRFESDQPHHFLRCKIARYLAVSRR